MGSDSKKGEVRNKFQAGAMKVTAATSPEPPTPGSKETIANKNAGGPLKIIEKYVKSVSPVTGPEPPTPAPKKISKQEKK